MMSRAVKENGDGDEARASMQETRVAQCASLKYYRLHCCRSKSQFQIHILKTTCFLLEKGSEYEQIFLVHMIKCCFP